MAKVSDNTADIRTGGERGAGDRTFGPVHGRPPAKRNMS